jgi:hypothetical protein
MKDSSVLKKFLIGAVLATSFLTVGCGEKKEETISPEAIPQIPPSDRNSALPGTDAKNSPTGGKPTKPAN